MLQTAAPAYHGLQRVKGMILHSQQLCKPLERFWLCRSLVSGPLKAPLGSVGASNFAQNISVPKRLRPDKHADGLKTFASAAEHTAADPRLLALNTETLRLPRFCAGCGVELQAEEPDHPGWASCSFFALQTSALTFLDVVNDDTSCLPACRYYQVPKKLLEAATAEVCRYHRQDFDLLDALLAHARLCQPAALQA